ncbi:nuclear pore complex protein Nup54-like [Corticium candelabrum]|uniref:nuclear pore complex protein Nup54-like n=1 Tax=Corticium candelabrum TaxID=121492 RepID=UPI002E25F0AC|nr:nuclear pore complex protein Nup54-like [Corticium candelabrum]
MQTGQTQGFKLGGGTGFGLGGQPQQGGLRLGLGAQTQGTGGLQLGLSQQQQQQQTGFRLGLGTTTTSQQTGGLGLGLGQPGGGLSLGGQTGGLGLGQTQKLGGFNLGLNQTKPTGLGLGLGMQSQTGGLQLGGNRGMALQLGGGGLGQGMTGLQLGKGLGLGQQPQGGGLGLTLGMPSGTSFGQQQQVQTAGNELTVMAFALSRPNVFGDERDAVIAKFNQLQAYWGEGKGFASQQDVVNFRPENPFGRFKSIAYNRLPTAKDEDGLLGLEFKQPESQLHDKSTVIQQEVHRILGGKPEFAVRVETIKGLPSGRCEVVLYVSEVSAAGGTRRVPASRLYDVLQSTMMQSQLKQVGVVRLYLKSGMTSTQIQSYLDNPPVGIDDFMWDTAKQENPDPNRMLPVPIIGLSELQQRIKQQEQETQQHQSRLKIIRDNVSQLQQQHTTTMAKLAQLRRKHHELQRRVLHVMVEQEITRKQGFAVQPDEEQLHIQLDSIQTELNAPMQFKGRLNELMSQIRLQSLTSPPDTLETQFALDPASLHEIKQHLKEQQRGLEHLKSILNDDLDDLAIIEQGLQDKKV